MDPAVALALVDTIAWVSMHAVASDAGVTMRSEALRPPWFPKFSLADDRGRLIETLLRSPSEPARALAFIAERRRLELASRRIPAPTVGAHPDPRKSGPVIAPFDGDHRHDELDQRFGFGFLAS